MKSFVRSHHPPTYLGTGTLLVNLFSPSDLFQGQGLNLPACQSLHILISGLDQPAVLVIWPQQVIFIATLFGTQDKIINIINPLTRTKIKSLKALITYARADQLLFIFSDF